MTEFPRYPKADDEREQAERDVSPVVESGLPGFGHIAVTLDDYQRSNLTELLKCCGFDGTAGAADRAVFDYNTGDWLGEVYWKLVKFGPTCTPPNKTLAMAREQAERGARALWAVRVLDEAGRRDRRAYYAHPVCKINGSWSVDLGPNKSHVAGDADDARISAAEALVAEDPTLGEP